MFRSKVVFTIGLLVGVLISGWVNYLTIREPSSYYNISHSPTFSGFPVAMYEYPFAEPGFILWDGFVINALSAFAFSFTIAWIMTKVLARPKRLE